MWGQEMEPSKTKLVLFCVCSFPPLIQGHFSHNWQQYWNLGHCLCLTYRKALDPHLLGEEEELWGLLEMKQLNSSGMLVPTCSEAEGI